MKIVTAGSRYLDIDAYAGIIAYTELLQKQDIPAKAVSTAQPNESVPKTVRSWSVELSSEYAPSSEDTFTLIDISTPNHFDTFVELERIDAVIDHHPGFEEYWQEKIGDGAHIETVGAACTQVYEFWKAAGLVHEMSETSARLLMCGILDNTLNFGAKITTERDHDAYDELMKYANLPSNWPAQYFGEIQRAIEASPVQAIHKDTKIVQFSSHEAPIHVGQFAVWDAAKLLKKDQVELLKAFEQYDEWFMNIISISEKRSYILCTDTILKGWLSKLLGVTFQRNVAVSDRLWLRKEIIKQDIELSGKKAE